MADKYNKIAREALLKSPPKEYNIGEIVELLEEADRRGLLETFAEDELKRMTVEQLRIIVEVKQ